MRANRSSRPLKSEHVPGVVLAAGGDPDRPHSEARWYLVNNKYSFIFTEITWIKVKVFVSWDLAAE